jgi:ADP-ribosylglycohydrolase
VSKANGKNQKLVGDTDTNAAIAGALLGAYYGYDKIIENDITRENIDILLKCDTTQGDIVRPYDYKLTEDFIADFIKN